MEYFVRNQEQNNYFIGTISSSKAISKSLLNWQQQFGKLFTNFEENTSNLLPIEQKKIK